MLSFLPVPRTSDLIIYSLPQPLHAQGFVSCLQTGKLWAKVGEAEAAEAALTKALQLGTRRGQVGLKSA